MALLSQWSAGLGLVHAGGARDPEVKGVTADSRRVREGDVFVAVPGTREDGLRFVGDALRQGAAAVVARSGAEVELPADTPFFHVPDPRLALGQLAREAHGCPDRELTLVAVTGTNGKTTVAHLTRELLELRGTPCGMIGTIGYRTGARDEPGAWTTPPPEVLFELLAEMVEHERRACSMEASSHALDQSRLATAEVDVAAFTNLSREHLEYHRDLEDYLQAKRRLLEHLDGPRRHKPAGRAVVHLDDPVFASHPWPRSTVGVGSGAGCEVRRLDARSDRRGCRLRLSYGGEPLELRSRLLGDYNLENLLVLAGIARALELEPLELESLFPRLHPVPGRLEVLGLDDDAPLVLLDYAHTPDALTSVLRSCRALTAGRLVVVFGCGGDRDRGKRPLMARAAGTAADLSVLTLDNPRTEDPSRIFADAERGFEGVGNEWVRVDDRSDALARALEGLGVDDTLLVAGKGHETYQILGDEKVHWDDRVVLREIWNERGGKS